MFPEAVTEEFRCLLRAMEDRAVNDAPFRGFDAGQVRFLGASEPVPEEDGMKIVFRFEVWPSPDGCDVLPFGNLGIGA